MRIDRERMDRDEKYLERLYKKGLIGQQESVEYHCRIRCFSHLEDVKKAIKKHETTKAMSSLLKLRGEIDELHSLRPFMIYYEIRNNKYYYGKTIDELISTVKEK